MAERRHGGRRSDARGGGRGGGRGDLRNEEAARQRDLRDIENDDLRQQVRDLQRDIENGDLRQQVRDLQRRLARLEKRRRKSNPMTSNAPERRSMEDPLVSDVFTSSEAEEPSMNCNNNILSMPVYDTPVYDEDILSMPVYDKPVYDEDVLSMSVYNKPVYDEAEGGNCLLGFMFGGAEEEAIAGDLAIPVDLNRQKNNGVSEEGTSLGLAGNGVLNAKIFNIAYMHDRYSQTRLESHDVVVKDDSVVNGVYRGANQSTAESAVLVMKNVELSSDLVLSDHNQVANKSDDVEFSFNSYKSDQSKEEDLFGGWKEIEKYIYSFDHFHASKRARIDWIVEDFEMDDDVLTFQYNNCNFDEVDVQVGFGILDLDPIKEFGFVEHGFDGYPKGMMHDIQNWNWFVKKEVRDGEDDDDRDKAGLRIDSRTSLFQEGEYDAVIKDKSWRLRKIYFEFYLFPS